MDDRQIDGAEIPAPPGPDDETGHWEYIVDPNFQFSDTVQASRGEWTWVPNPYPTTYSPEEPMGWKTWASIILILAVLLFLLARFAHLI